MQRTKNSIKFPLLVILLLLIGSCTYEFPPAPEEPEIDPGSLNIDRIVILGGSLSAGYMNGALYTEGQNYAYGAQLARRLKPDAEETFYQTLSIQSEHGFNVEELNSEQEYPGRFYYSYPSATRQWPARIPLNGEPIPDFSGPLSQINNFSIPFLNSYGVDNAEALSGNQYFNRISGKQEGETLLDLAIRNNPTVFFFEPGTGDIFNYAIYGAAGDIDPDPGNTGFFDLTPVSVFEESVDNALQRIISETQAEVFLFNIPDPLVHPYFNALPWYYPEEEWVIVRSANNIASYYDGFNIRVQEYNRSLNDFSNFRPVIVFDNIGGQHLRAKVIRDEYLPDATDSQGQEIPKYRQLNSDDMFLYSGDDILRESLQEGATFGTLTPIFDQFVITNKEAAIIKERREEFNAIIRGLADQYSQVHLVDLDALMQGIENGSVQFQGVTFNLNLETSSVISSDAYNLNERGQALLANELIKIIKREYGARIPPVDINSLEGNDIRNDF